MDRLPFPRRPERPGPVQIFDFGPLRFNIDQAKLLAANRAKYVPERRRPADDWFDSRIAIDERHLANCGTDGLVLFATIILDGRPVAVLIDGNHRARRAMREGADVSAITLDFEDTLKILSGPRELLAEMRRDGTEWGMLAGTP